MPVSVGDKVRLTATVTETRDRGAIALEVEGQTVHLPERVLVAGGHTACGADPSAAACLGEWATRGCPIHNGLRDRRRQITPAPAPGHGKPPRGEHPEA